MKSRKFNTTLKCSGCVAKATPYLNEALGTGNWEVDLNAPVKVLTVHTDINEEKVRAALEKAGYKGEQIN